MKKIVYLIALFVVILSLPLGFSGCGADASGNGDNAGSATSSFQIEDLDWSVAEGIADGERYALLDYTNNSKYTVIEFEMQFKQKDGITDEEKEKYYSDVKEMFSIDESDPDDAEHFEDIKNRDIAMYAKSKQIAKAGETVSGIHCYYYSGYYYVKDMNHYALVVPDIATIRYIDKEKVFTVYYDYSAQKYTYDSKTEPAYYWTERGLEKVIPKPEADYVKNSGWDDSSCFIFEVCGWTVDDFNSYVKQCKEYGFIIDAEDADGIYIADSADGYNIELFYDENDFSMSGAVTLIEETE